MKISAPLEVGTDRRNVWCLSNEITNNGDGTYSFINLPENSLGFGSKVYVIDVPAQTFYYDNIGGKLYKWTLTDDTQTISVQTASGSITAGETTVTVNFVGTFINAYAYINNEILICDVDVSLGNVVFTLKEAIIDNVTCIIIYS